MTIRGDSGAHVRPKTEPPDPANRSSAIWRKAPLIVCGSAVIALLVCGVSFLLPASYSASTTVRVVAQANSGISPQDTVSASNQLATQLSHLVDTPQVRTAATEATGSNFNNASISASTVAGQNLVLVTAASNNKDAAAQAALANATAFVSYAQQLSGQRTDEYSQPLDALQTQIQDQIKTTQKDIQNSPANALSDRIQRLNALEGRLYDVQHEIAAQKATQPDIRVVSTTTASKTSPRPALYGAVAFAVALLVLSEIVVRSTGRTRDTGNS